MRKMKLATEYTAKILQRIVIGVMVVFLCASLTGCNAQQKAQHISGVIQGILNIAQAEESALPAADAPVVQHWVTLGFALDTQLNTCIAASGNKGAKLGACFNAFAAGLVNPAELTNLRITTQASQQRVQLYATAAIIAVNAALSEFGGAPQPAPALSAPVKAAELHALAARLGISLPLAPLG